MPAPECRKRRLQRLPRQQGLAVKQASCAGAWLEGRHRLALAQRILQTRRSRNHRCPCDWERAAVVDAPCRLRQQRQACFGPTLACRSLCLPHPAYLGSRCNLRHLLPLLLQRGRSCRAPLLQLLRTLPQLGECGSRVRALALPGNGGEPGSQSQTAVLKRSAANCTPDMILDNPKSVCARMRPCMALGAPNACPNPCLHTQP